MSEFTKGTVIGFSVGTMVLFLFVMVPFTSPNRTWQMEATKRGLGIFCPVNGEFAWKGECDKEEEVND